jgi:hypothetical protein
VTSPDTAAADDVDPLLSARPSDNRARILRRMGDLGRAASGRASALRSVPGIGTWFGLLLVLVGGAVLVIGWSRLADIGVLALQMPYLISAGGAGLGLIAVGLAIIAISAMVTDAVGACTA